MKYNNAIARLRFIFSTRRRKARSWQPGVQYHAGDINLKSRDITWLVVSSTSAQFKGVGTINGEGLCTFRVRAKDGDQGAGTSDEFTIRIWEGTDTEADPIYKALHAELGGGNIVVHKK